VMLRLDHALARLLTAGWVRCRAGVSSPARRLQLTEVPPRDGASVERAVGQAWRQMLRAELHAKKEQFVTADRPQLTDHGEDEGGYDDDECESMPEQEASEGW
jgi:hypothetical protein